MNQIVNKTRKNFSPLRYPGGKASLYLFLSKLIEDNKIKNCTYVEPYAGGAGAALNLLFFEKVDCIIINDLDIAIYSFWKSILDNTELFIQKIIETNITIDEWHNQKEIYKNKNSSELDLGFATFFLNRTNRSGIIEGGPIGGKKQEGKWLLNARFNKEELVKRIRKIASYKSRITVTNYDGIELIKKVSKLPNIFVYLDPPYYVKGSSLYLNHYENNNHQQLSTFLTKHQNFYWILTYDNAPQISKLYEVCNKITFNLKYHIDLPKEGEELLIFSNKLIFDTYPSI